MIVEIEGILGEKRAGYAIIRTSGGLGYGVEVPHETEMTLPNVGERTRLYTHLIIREDTWRLIGFSTEIERMVFLDLLDVNGVGVKGALSVMSHLGVERLRQVVLSGDWKELKGSPGIGTKIAQRIQLELLGRWGNSEERDALMVTAPVASASPTEDDVVSALVSLGYHLAEAQDAVRGVRADAPQERLREALRALDRGRAR